MKTPVQDCYPEEFSFCYGCGRLNPFGLHIKTVWDGEKSQALFQPRPEHVALPGFVYGGLLASLIDCHGVGTVGAAATEKYAQPDQPPKRYVTASLKVDFLRPTPLHTVLTVEGRIAELTERKGRATVTIYADGVQTVSGEVIAVPMPGHMAVSPEALQAARNLGCDTK